MHKLPHYLRSERRRAAFTQADVAALLGTSRKQRVCWYEAGKLPPVEAALAYEAIFRKPAAELLGGAYDRVASDVRRRARALLAGEEMGGTPRGLRRRQSLAQIAGE